MDTLSSGPFPRRDRTHHLYLWAAPGRIAQHWATLVVIYKKDNRMELLIVTVGIIVIAGIGAGWHWRRCVVEPTLRSPSCAVSFRFTATPPAMTHLPVY
jgi:hypothetical protein